jgi:CHAD domain-containing protein
VTRKITHVLGEPPRVEPEGLPAVVATYLRDQCAAILLGDVGLRDDPTPQAVHATRVGVRRLRSTLRLFDHVVDEAPESFDEDLGWLAGLLSPIRDADILGRRLSGALDDLEPHDVVGPVADEIVRELRSARRAGLEKWRRAAEEPRYRGIMATLVRWYASVPVRDDARVRPGTTLRKARKKVRRRLTEATDAHGLHQTRKSAKRLRYASDLLEPARPKAAAIAKRAKKLQTTLGEHQDLAVASDFVRSMAESGRVENAFTYGVLADRFDTAAAEIREAVLDR